MESLSTANTLVGNTSHDTGWELSMARATFRASKDLSVAAVGGTAVIEFGSDQFESGCAFSLPQGREFTVLVPTKGARVYVAWNSHSYHANWKMRLIAIPTSVANRNDLRITSGPQAELFDYSLLNTPFIVSQLGNRVGIRLVESIGSHAIELPSEPQCIGAVQVTNDGTLILIGPDGPTIGGYPKIAVVVSSDVNRIGQLQPGESIYFSHCDIAQARDISRMAAEEQDRNRLLIRLAAQRA